jgi:hypothetical protein
LFFGNDFIERLCAVVGAIGEQVLEPRSTLADGIEDGLCPGTAGDVRRQIDHQQ